eukprot:2478801-Amphidinium_carterae.1
MWRRGLAKAQLRVRAIVRSSLWCSIAEFVNMLRREFGTKAEIDLVREIEQLDMDIKKYQDQS